MGNNPICTLLSKLLLKSHCGIMAVNEENRGDRGGAKETPFVGKAFHPEPLPGIPVCKVTVDW